jgi:hypothetical protein
MKEPATHEDTKSYYLRSKYSQDESTGKDNVWCKKNDNKNCDRKVKSKWSF